MNLSLREFCSSHSVRRVMPIFADAADLANALSDDAAMTRVSMIELCALGSSSKNGSRTP
jgi:hypothetical protein